MNKMSLKLINVLLIIFGLAHTETNKRPRNPAMQSPLLIHQDGFSGWAQQKPGNYLFKIFFNIFSIAQPIARSSDYSGVAQMESWKPNPESVKPYPVSEGWAPYPEEWAPYPEGWVPYP